MQYLKSTLSLKKSLDEINGRLQTHKKTSELENMSMRIIQTEAYREKRLGWGVEDGT